MNIYLLTTHIKKFHMHSRFIMAQSPSDQQMTRANTQSPTWNSSAPEGAATISGRDFRVSECPDDIPPLTLPVSQSSMQTTASNSIHPISLQRQENIERRLTIAEACILFGSARANHHDDDSPEQLEAAQETNTIENVIKNLSDQQMTFPPDTICPTISTHYHVNGRKEITNFFKNSLRMVTYGYSSGGMRAHILYRSDLGKLFLVYKTPFDKRIYYLQKDMLYYIFEDHDIAWRSVVFMYYNQISPDME